MKKVTLLFIILGLIALFFADIEIVSLSPLTELKRMGRGALFPDFFAVRALLSSLLNTLVFAFCGITIGFVTGALFAPLYRFRLLRYIFTFVRSIHEVFWAFLLLPVVGLNPICGVLAIAVPYSGIFAKRLYEIYQEVDLRPFHILPRAASGISRVLYGAIPLLSDEVKAFTSYRFECALRSSAVLGFIGLPTIGYHLESFFKEGYYAQAFALLYLFYIMVWSKKFWLHLKLIPLYVITSFMLLSKKIHFLWANIQRFFTYDIVPWPMRRTGFIEGTDTIEWAWPETVTWLKKIWNAELFKGIVQTAILTQIAFILAGIISFVLLFMVSRYCFKGFVRKLFSLLLLLLRTTPEYIIAFLAILLWGPSMLPGIVALAIHNGAVVALLTAKSISGLKMPVDAPKGRVERFFYVIVPQIYGAFLGNLFYRWEVMVRESALLGILGIYTLGFYIDSAIADDKMDKAIVVIVTMAFCTIVIDSLSKRVRAFIKT